jgi:hypothetical protein
MASSARYCPVPCAAHSSMAHVSGTDGGERGHICVWDVISWAFLSRWAIVADQRMYRMCWQGTQLICRLAGGGRTQLMKGGILSLCLTRQDQLLLSSQSNNQVIIWDATHPQVRTRAGSTRTDRRTMAMQRCASARISNTEVAFLPDRTG